MRTVPTAMTVTSVVPPKFSALCLRAAEMERVSEVLQFPVIIEWVGPLSLESQFLQKLDFLLTSIAAEGSITKEFFQSRLFAKRLFRFAFNKLKLLNVPWS